MKNICTFLMVMLSVSLFSQSEKTEMKAHRMGEAGRFQKLSNFNVNPNTLNYDLRYQRIELTVNPEVQFISGKVTSHFIPNENLNSIYFDLTNNLTVSEVLYHGNSVNFTQFSTKEIRIDFNNEIQSGTTDSLSIKYSGVPETSNNGIYFANHSTGKVAFTLTEPYGSREWFPAKQSLNDKVERVDLLITAPAQYSTAGNGTLISETENAGWKTAFWKTEYPIPAYLIAIGVSNYVKQNSTMGNPPFPFVNYLFPHSDSNSYVQNNLEWAKQLMEMFEEHFGPYPYRNEKYGHMEMTLGGGMEHATMTSMGMWTEDLIAHELAHQWFGDKITCRTWNDIWLNEGFATFGQHLNNEKFLMNHQQFMQYLQGQKDYITSLPSGSVYVSDALLGDIYTIFNGRLSYSKGGYVLRMIKWILGDDAFYQALKDYAARPALAYAYAETGDFSGSLQQSTGKDFSGFMNDWIYGQGYPQYEIRWKQSGNKIAFLVNQSQSHTSVDFFEMPLPIKVNGTSGETAYLRLENTSNGQYFEDTVDFTVDSVEFNYEFQILERNSVVMYDAGLKSNETNLSNISIFPNPAKDILNVSGLSKNFDYEIIGTDGRLLQKGQANGQVSVSGLAKGMYFLKIENRNFKFLKE
ncbi:MAG: M1 family aminopeptidase [Bergeyella sp.]